MHKLEQGLLTVFQLILAWRIVFWLYEALLLNEALQFKTTTQNGILVVTDVALLALVFVLRPRPRRAVKSLPPLLGIATIPLFLETYWLLSDYQLTPATERFAIGALPLTHDVLLLLILIAWQYRVVFAFAYIAVTALIDWWLFNQFLTSGTDAYYFTFEDLTLRTITYAIIAIVVAYLMRRQRAQHTQLRQARDEQTALNAQLAYHAAVVEQLAITEERNRLARELHDTLAHSLSALTVQLEAVSSLWAVDQQAAHKMLTNASETTRSGLTEARRALQALRATPLETDGLTVALGQLAQQRGARGGLSVSAEITPALPTLPVATEQAIYRIAQEAMENIVRHAEADNMHVQLTSNEQSIILTITDDGIGFDYSEIDDERMGIRGMHERALLVGGELTITQTVPHGTQVQLQISRR